MGKLYLLIKRECLIAGRQPVTLISPAILYILVLSFFGLILSHHSTWQILYGPICVVLAPLFCFLSIEAVLQEDVYEGVLETFVVQRVSLEHYFLAKVLSHWILKGIPISFLSWGIGVLNFSFHSQFSALLISLLFLTFIVIIWALLGMVVSNGIKNSGMVLLLIFPLIIPPFLIVQIILSAAQSGLEFLSYLVMLSGILLMTFGMGIVAVPFMIRLILR